MNFSSRHSQSPSFAKLGWNELKSIKDLDGAMQASYDRPVALYKHSTSCGISASVMDRLMEEWDLKVDSVDFYYLDLLRHRDVSNAIAQRLGVVHQSPQLIVVIEGEAVYDSSHHRVSIAGLKKAIAG